ncbi:MAG: transposase [Bacteroidota bacterium]
MHFETDQIYHVYNQGNNRQQLFYSDENYQYFLRLYRKFIFGKADLLAYCLMPNHFHLLIKTTSESVKMKQVGSLQLTELSNGIRMMLTSYSSAINKQLGNTGSQFRQKTKAKLLDSNNINYPFVCFNYIHQNPLRSGLVVRMESWEFSSFRDFAGLRNNSICNIELAKRILDFGENNFIEESYRVINSDLINSL